MAQPTHPTMLPPADPGGGRDELIDLLRSLATTTVVLWHWVFTILVWRADGPHADNPIGYVSGLLSTTTSSTDERRSTVPSMCRST